MSSDNPFLTEGQIDRMVNTLSIGIMVLDINDKVVVCNNSLLTLLSVNSKASLYSCAFFQKIISTIRSFKSQNNHEFELKLVVKEQNQIMVTGNISEEETIVKVESVINSDDVEVESVQAILEGQENERRRIGREIHDGVGPMLSFIKLSFDSVVEEIIQSEFKHPELLRNISETIDVVTGDLRALSHRLIPRTLDEFGLYSAFSNLIFKLNDSRKAQFDFYSNLNAETRFEEEVELSLYRCAQELLNNAIKYSNAKNIMVQVILHKDSIILMVEDDGVGFDMAEIDENHQGIGLTNVETRVKLLDGEFNLDSHKGRGTVVSVEIPVKK